MRKTPSKTETLYFNWHIFMVVVTVAAVDIAPHAIAFAEEATSILSPVGPFPTSMQPKGLLEQGAYVGIHLGERRTSTSWTAKQVLIGGFEATGPNNDAGLGSQQLRVKLVAGYDWMDWRNCFGCFVGVVADVGYGDNQSTQPRIPGTWGPGARFVLFSPTNPLYDNIGMRLTWDVSVRGRFGLAVSPSTKVYVTGGTSLVRMNAIMNYNGLLGSPPHFGGFALPTYAMNSTIRTGWVIGAGIEFSLRAVGFQPGWFGQVEYLHADYGTWTTTLGNHSISSTAAIRINTDTVMAGFIYKFGAKQR